MVEPIAVLVADVHYNLQTLELADAAMRQAILRANTLNVPLIVAGDLTDNKANMRAEVVNRMLETFTLPRHAPYVLVGNHDKCNEKSEDHALEFLRDKVTLVDTAEVMPNVGLLISYQHDVTELKQLLKKWNAANYINIIMHQGLKSSNSGEYIQDGSAITLEDVKGLRIISGHYHTRQTVGNWDFVGNPFTLNFAEAFDPPKGFQILKEDATLEFVPTNLRKHVVIDIKQGWNETDYSFSSEYLPGDILKVRYTAAKSLCVGVTKDLVRRLLDLPKDSNFQLEVLPISSKLENPVQNPSLSQRDQITSLIEQLDINSQDKTRIKQLLGDL